MKKTIAIIIASALIVGTAYYWWILVIAFVSLIGWSMFRVNKSQKRLDKEIEDMYCDRDGIKWGDARW